MRVGCWSRRLSHYHPLSHSDAGAQVKAALALWDGPSAGGSFVFTSSMSVCSAEDGEVVTEDSCPMVAMGKGPSTDRLLGAEQAVMQVEGRGRNML